MNVIFVPDVHGRIFWKKFSGYIPAFDRTIFCGDYLDPYPDEDVDCRPDALLKNLDDIVSLKKAYPDKVSLLIGNHDFHYIIDEPMASRFDYGSRERYNKYFNENIEFFDLLQLIDGCLFTHAGVAKDWGDRHGIRKDTVAEDIENLYYDHTEAFIEAGWMRGGLHPSGSIFWSDVDEPKMRDWYQVFGHTRMKGPVITDEFASLDCSRTFIVNTKTLDVLQINEL